MKIIFVRINKQVAKKLLLAKIRRLYYWKCRDWSNSNKYILFLRQDRDLWNSCTEMIDSIEKNFHGQFPKKYHESRLDMTKDIVSKQSKNL